MAIEKEAVIILLRQVFVAKPELREQIKSSREVLFTILARVYILDEMRRELSFQREEISELFDALLAPTGAGLSSKRLDGIFHQIMRSSEELVTESEFRKVVASSLLEAVKARLGGH